VKIEQIDSIQDEAPQPLPTQGGVDGILGISGNSLQENLTLDKTPNSPTSCPTRPTDKKKAGRPKGVFGLKRQIQEYARNPDLALPKTDNQRIKDLKDMLIRSSGKDVVEKMISIALNDNHPAQMAAIKMCVDRTLPVSMFEKDKSQRSAVNITITGIGAPTVATTTIDAEEPKDIEDIEAKDG
jgi:hypothetical protein